VDGFDSSISDIEIPRDCCCIYLCNVRQERATERISYEILFKRRFMALQDKISSRLDELEGALTRQEHLTSPSQVADLIGSLTKFISAMSDEDIDFVQVATDVLENQRRWNLN